MRDGVTPEVEEAVLGGWLACGQPTLDAGCGRGDVAAFLAQQGFPVLGIDIAQSAVDRARERHRPGPGGPRFERHDLCVGPAPGAPYINLLDCGCYAVVDPEDRPLYARNLALSAAPGARILLLVKAFGEPPDADLADERKRCEDDLERSFEGRIAVERVQRCGFGTGTAGRRLPGLAFRLRVPD